MRILFLCTGNSCRSQMAEHLARAAAPADAAAVISSAGIDPQDVHPLTHRVLQEIGVDSSGARSRDIDPQRLNEFDLVITLCGDARDNCPVLPASVCHQHWPIPDPAAVSGSEEVRLEAFRRARDELRRRIEHLFRPAEKRDEH